MVGIGGVPHAEEEPQEKQRRQIGDRVRQLGSPPCSDLPWLTRVRRGELRLLARVARPWRSPASCSVALGTPGIPPASTCRLTPVSPGSVAGPAHGRKRPHLRSPLPRSPATSPPPAPIPAPLRFLPRAALIVEIPPGSQCGTGGQSFPLAPAVAPSARAGPAEALRGARPRPTASTSRSRGGALVTSASRNSRAAAATSSTARSNAASVGLRGPVKAAELAHELQRCGPDLGLGRGRLEVEQRPDVPAHGTCLRRSFRSAWALMKGQVRRSRKGVPEPLS